jgi:hypothetical protein
MTEEGRTAYGSVNSVGLKMLSAHGVMGTPLRLLVHSAAFRAEVISPEGRWFLNRFSRALTFPARMRRGMIASHGSPP